jgi:uncharacterized protein YjiS (DUF1127 family)
MSPPVDRLAPYQAQSAEARQQLTATLVELQARLNPRALARQALQELRETGEELAQSGLATAKAHPVPLVAAVAAMTLVALRGPLAAWMSKRQSS